MSREYNKIMVGDKPLDRYIVTALDYLLDKTELEELIIEARGSQNIGKAITLATYLISRQKLEVVKTDLKWNKYKGVEGQLRIGCEAQIILKKGKES